jgi:hypothetical protein
MARKDGHRLKTISSFQKIYTFFMPKRSEAIVWDAVEVDVAHTVDFINKKKLEGHDITIFELVISALLRTTSQFPEINRFIYNHKFYARDEYSAAFAMNIEGKIVLRKVFAQPEWDIFMVSKKIKEVIDSTIKKPTDSNDNTIDFFMKLPNFISSFCAILYPWLIDKGILPYASYKDNPLFSSCVVSDIGSFGLMSLYHHLYDWGNTSVFVTIGAMHKAPVVTPEGTLKVSDVIKFGFTIDERICDGKKLSDMLLFFKECVENPWVLEKHPPQVIRE